MKLNRTKHLLSLLIITAFFILSCSGGSDPKRIVILIGDGMGFEQVRAAEYFNGESFSIKSNAVYSGSMTTTNYYSEVTDSAASGTAMATGQKVANGVLSMRIPGTGSDIETIFEYAVPGYKLGLVSTSYMTDATPSSFVAHTESRANYAEIAADYLSFQPDLVMGGIINLIPSDFEDQGYSVYSSIGEYDQETYGKIFVKISDGRVPYEYDIYNSEGELPHYLSSSSEIVMKYFGNRNRFIIMIEGGRIDHACHAASIENSIYETNEFFLTAGKILNWLKEKGDYLMIITADHETGGLNVLADNGTGVFPTVEWTSDSEGGYYSHTDREVPVFVFSDILNVDECSVVTDNADVYSIVKSFVDR